MGNEQVASTDNDEKQQKNDNNIVIDECFWNEDKALLSHNLLMKHWGNEMKFDIHWKNEMKFKDTSKEYSNSSLSLIKMDEYGGKHLNSIWYKHPNFILKRRAIQHDIIDIFVENAIIKHNKIDSKPWIIFVGGASCIGKSFMLSQLLKYDLINELKKENCIIDNHDLIRPLLPEWQLYLKDKDKTPMYDLLYTELVYIFQCIMWRGLESGKNILIDGTMKNYFSYKRFMEIIQTNYKHYNIGFIFIQIKEFNMKNIEERLKKRMEKTGRQTPLKIVKDSYEKSIVTYNKLKKGYNVDAAIRIVNIGEGNDVCETPVIFDHINLECKLKHLIKWRKNDVHNQSLLNVANDKSFITQIDKIVKESP